MRTRGISQRLVEQDTRTTKIFLWIFYLGCLINLVFALVHTPWATEQQNTVAIVSRAFVLFVIEIFLFPIAVLLLRRQSVSKIKYIYYIVFTLSDLINEVTLYWGHGRSYSSGSAVEILFVLFAPIFIDNLYLLFVSIGTIAKYVVLGIALHAPQVLIPIALIVIITVVSFIILGRFRSYASAIESVHEERLGELVAGIISVVELKDEYTRGHSERVAFYAKLLAEASDIFTADELKSLNYACLLHDIGKVNIPDSILMKPGPLTKDEYALIKTHPVIGSNTIRNIDGLEPCMDVVLYHHERWDGTGYPEGLKGQAIPLLARITAIADAFDAMTSSRSYRPAMTGEEAYRIIVSGRDSQFDPKLVDVFQQVFPRFVSYLGSGRRSLGR